MNVKAVLAGAALVCVILAPVVIAAEGIVGYWEFKSQIPARTRQATMTITKTDGKLAGTWSTQRGESTLSDITFENGKVKFTQTMNFGGQEMKTTYEGTLEGGKLKGTAKAQGTGPFGGESTFEGTLEGEAKTGADAIVGKWQMSITTPARDVVNKMTITKNADGTLAGKWTAERGENTISGLKLEGNKLTFALMSNMGGREMTSDFEGTVEGDNIKGVFKSDRGDREANATRVGAMKSEASKAEPNKPATPKPEPKPEPNKPK